MPKVQAKCTAKCWDSRGEIFGFPVLCSPGEVYEIPTDGLLAQLTVHPVAYDANGNAVRYFRDNNGELKTTKVPKPPYIFEFDRNSPAGETRDYTCKECGEPCKTLAELGRHTYSKHPAGSAEAAPEDEDDPLADRTCHCGKVCKSVYGLRLHREKSHPEAVMTASTAETASVPA